MSGMLDMNQAESQRDFGASIPDGTFAMVRMAFKPGGYTLPNLPQQDDHLFKQARPPSDAIMLETTFTVLFGPHAKRQVFQNFTIDGGSRNEDGSSKAWNISKSFFRAAVESAMGIDPKDESAAAKAKRNMPCFWAINGLEFAVRIGIESDRSGQYSDKNQISHVVTPDEPEYPILKSGQIPPPQPRSGGGARPAAARGPATPAPAWQQATAPVQAPIAAQQAIAAWQQQVPSAGAAQPPVAPPQSTWGQPAGQPAPAQPQPAPAAQPTTPAQPKGPSWLIQP